VSTPHLLDAAAPPPHRPDPLAAVLSALGVVVIAGLCVAAVLAVYTYSTPDAEGTVVAVTAAVFGAALALAVAVATLRHVRAGGRA
jgi:FtsH-binding integral membrane protein